MPSAGSIFVDLLLNDAKFVSGTKRASKGMEDFEKIVSKSAKVAATALAAAGAAVTALTIRQLQAIDATAKTARSLGILTSNFQALALVADEAGVGQDQLAVAITKTQKAIAEGAAGSENYNRAFKQLGLSAKELLNLRPDEQFQRIADALGQIENPTQRTALALEIFGRSGRGVIGMLTDLNSKTEEAREFNDRFNISISEIDARKVEEANDTFARLGRALGGIGNTIAIEVAPAITAVSQAILGTTFKVDDLGIAVRTSMDWIAAMAEILRRAFHGVEVAIAGVNVALTSLTPGPLAPEWLKKYLDSDEESKKYLNQILENFDEENTIVDRLYQARADANKRALEAVGKETGFGTANIDDEEAISRAAKSQRELASIYQKNRDLILGLDSATLNYQDTIEDLNKLLKAGTIDQNQYNDAVQRAQEEFEKASAKANVWAFDMEAAGKKASENIHQALADFLFNPAEKGFKGMLKGFVDVLRRMAAEAAAAQILKSLFGEGGFNFGSIGKSFEKALPTVKLGSFNLPKFATGIDTVPHDMAAVIHKDEAVLNKQDAAAWRSGNTGGNTYQIDARGADQGAVRRLEQALLALAGPGVIESRVTNAQSRGAV